MALDKIEGNLGKPQEVVQGSWLQALLQRPTDPEYHPSEHLQDSGHMDHLGAKLFPGI